MLRLLIILFQFCVALGGSKPNIVFILTDDLGIGDNSIDGYSKSIDDFPNNIETPNLERLAKGGMIFTKAYVDSSVCGPSRYSMMTGRSTGVSPIRRNTGEGKDYRLAKSDITIFQLLQKEGYHCGLIGKWGFETHPFEAGFSKFYGQLSHVDAHDMFPDKMYDNTIENGKRNRNLSIKDNRKASEKRCTKKNNSCKFVHDLFTTEALSYIEDRSSIYREDNSKPFFLFLSYSAPHPGKWGSGQANRIVAPNYTCPEGLKLPDEASKEDFCRYRSVVTEYIDRDVGRVVDAIKKAEILRDTLIIFTSDNGPDDNLARYKKKVVFDPNTFKSTAGLKGGKRSVYEGGLRVPFICFWEEHIKSGKKNDLRFQLSDLFSTLADIVGIDLDSQRVQLNPYVDSRSIYPAMRNKKVNGKNYLYFEYCHLQVENWKEIRDDPNSLCSWAVISEKYKLIFDPEVDGPKDQLYELERDESESNNLLLSGSSKYEKIREDLLKLRTKAYVPLQSTGFVGSRAIRDTIVIVKDEPARDDPSDQDDKDKKEEDDEPKDSKVCGCDGGYDLVNSERKICISSLPYCPLVGSIEEARSVCERDNARLCTDVEARIFVPFGAECYMDKSFVWTEEKCSDGRQLFVKRKKQKKKCREPDYRAKVRCCKDMC